MKTKQIVFTEAYKAELLEVECQPPKAGEVTICLEYSAISAGTEKANFIGSRASVFDDEDVVYGDPAEPPYEDDAVTDEPEETEITDTYQ